MNKMVNAKRRERLEEILGEIDDAEAYSRVPRAKAEAWYAEADRLRTDCRGWRTGLRSWMLSTATLDAFRRRLQALTELLGTIKGLLARREGLERRLEKTAIAGLDGPLAPLGAVWERLRHVQADRVGVAGRSIESTDPDSLERAAGLLKEAGANADRLDRSATAVRAALGARQDNPPELKRQELDDILIRFARAHDGQEQVSEPALAELEQRVAGADARPPAAPVSAVAGVSEGAAGAAVPMPAAASGSTGVGPAATVEVGQRAPSASEGPAPEAIRELRRWVSDFEQFRDSESEAGYQDLWRRFRDCRSAEDRAGMDRALEEASALRARYVDRAEEHRRAETAQLSGVSKVLRSLDAAADASVPVGGIDLSHDLEGLLGAPLDRPERFKDWLVKIARVRAALISTLEGDARFEPWFRRCLGDLRTRVDAAGAQLEDAEVAVLSGDCRSRLAEVRAQVEALEPLQGAEHLVPVLSELERLGSDLAGCEGHIEQAAAQRTQQRADRERRVAELIERCKALEALRIEVGRLDLQPGDCTLEGMATIAGTAGLDAVDRHLRGLEAAWTTVLETLAGRIAHAAPRGGARVQDGVPPAEPAAALAPKQLEIARGLRGRLAGLIAETHQEVERLLGQLRARQSRATAGNPLADEVRGLVTELADSGVGANSAVPLPMLRCIEELERERMLVARAQDCLYRLGGAEEDDFDRERERLLGDWEGLSVLLQRHPFHGDEERVPGRFIQDRIADLIQGLTLHGDNLAQKSNQLEQARRLLDSLDAQVRRHALAHLRDQVGRLDTRLNQAGLTADQRAGIEQQLRVLRQEMEGEAHPAELSERVDQHLRNIRVAY